MIITSGRDSQSLVLLMQHMQAIIINVSYILHINLGRGPCHVHLIANKVCCYTKSKVHNFFILFYFLFTGIIRNDVFVSITDNIKQGLYVN